MSRLASPQSRSFFVVISGCSGGGKSTLLAELSRRGYAVVAEPGRRIVQEELKGDGQALPWVDAPAFLLRAIEMAIADLERAGALRGWVFFDRGLVDAASALQHVTGEQVLGLLGQSYRYHRRVFLAPPWPEIYVNDPERRHGFDAALDEYARLLEAYPALGYDVVVLPKVGCRNEQILFWMRWRRGPDGMFFVSCISFCRQRWEPISSPRALSVREQVR